MSGFPEGVLGAAAPPQTVIVEQAPPVIPNPIAPPAPPPVVLPEPVPAPAMTDTQAQQREQFRSDSFYVATALPALDHPLI